MEAWERKRVSCCSLTRVQKICLHKYEVVQLHLIGKKSFSLSVYLTSIMTLDSTCTEAASRQDEDLLGDCIDLAYAFVIIDNWHWCLPNPQGNWASCGKREKYA